jgi:very-short-patch-repair endonuclease
MRPRPQFSLQEKRKFAALMRRNPTDAEAIMWECLRDKHLGYQFRRQITTYGYIVDFWCAALRIAIEVDGSAHHSEEARARDVERDYILRRNEISVLRFTNEEIFNVLEMVIADIRRECKYRHAHLFKGLYLPTRVLTSSSSRACASVDKSKQITVRADLPPPEQRITEADLCELTTKIGSIARQHSMDFDDYKRPSSEKAWEQRYRLNEVLKARKV